MGELDPRKDFPTCPKCGANIEKSEQLGNGAFPQQGIGAALLIVYHKGCGGVLPYTLVPIMQPDAKAGPQTHGRGESPFLL